jgi:hypothetical protein
LFVRADLHSTIIYFLLDLRLGEVEFFRKRKEILVVVSLKSLQNICDRCKDVVLENTIVLTELLPDLSKSEDHQVDFVSIRWIFWT